LKPVVKNLNEIHILEKDKIKSNSDLICFLALLFSLIGVRPLGRPDYISYSFLKQKNKYFITAFMSA